MSRTRQTHHLALTLGLTLAAASLTAACGGQEPSTRTEKLSVPSTAQGARADALPPALHLVAGEIRDLEGISPAQEVALKQLVADLRATTAPWRSLRRDLLTLAARQVRQGAIDRASLHADVKKVRALMRGKARALAVEALDRLHGILTPAQRRALVDRLRDRRHDHHAPLSRLSKLFTPLGLSADQRQTIAVALATHLAPDGALARRRHRQAELRAAADAFVSDHFAASTLAILTPPAPAVMTARLDRALAVAEKILPLLTEAQRDTLATLIEARALTAPGPAR